jgi:hypothetical protein
MSKGKHSTQKKQKEILRVRGQDKIACNGHWDKKRQERHAHRQKKICDYWNLKSSSFTCNFSFLFSLIMQSYAQKTYI